MWLGTGSGDGQGGNWTDTVYRIDPQTDQITHRVDCPARPTGATGATSTAASRRSRSAPARVWATGGGCVARIDPDTGRLVATVDADAYRIAAGREGVWYLSPNDSGAVTPIDPRTNRALPPISVGDASLSGIAVGGGSVWVTAEREGFVLRITPGASPVTTPIDVGSGANYIAYGAGAVWVANSLDGTVSQDRPRARTRSPRRRRSARCMSLAAGAGSAWVSTAGATRAGTLPASACDDVPGGARADVLIASDLPLQGADDPAPRAMADAIRAVLAQHGFRAGKYTRRLSLVRRLDRGRPATFERRRCARQRERLRERRPARGGDRPVQLGLRRGRAPDPQPRARRPAGHDQPHEHRRRASRARACRRRTGTGERPRSSTPSAPATTSA